MTSRFLPRAAGVGFKPIHAHFMAGGCADVAFIEVHAENYMGDGGPVHAQLRTLRARYALSIHGVGLSIGSPGALDAEHLARLKRLIDRYQPESFSEHLAWSTHGNAFLNDLLPIAYTDDTLRRVVDHVGTVQDVLGYRMLLENPSTYITFSDSHIPETEFIREVAQRTGCGLLLDVNNLFVSATNAGDDPATRLDGFPLELVDQIHLAGHSSGTDEDGDRFLIDDHGSPVADPVWELYRAAISHTGPVATLIEWDNDVPEWPVLLGEAQRAGRLLKSTPLSPLS